jgi:hypothetical protein
VSSMEPMHCTMLLLISCCTLSSSRFLASILPAAAAGEGAGGAGAGQADEASGKGEANRARRKCKTVQQVAPPNQHTQPPHATHYMQQPVSQRGRQAVRRACLLHHPAVQGDALLLHHRRVVLACRKNQAGRIERQGKSGYSGSPACLFWSWSGQRAGCWLSACCSCKQPKLAAQRAARPAGSARSTDQHAQ